MKTTIHAGPGPSSTSRKRPRSEGETQERPRKARRRSTPLHGIASTQLPSPLTVYSDLTHSSLRGEEEESRDQWTSCAHGLTSRRSDTAVDATHDQRLHGCEDEDLGCRRPLEHWARTLQWPPNFATMSQERSLSPKKRPSNSSYTKSYKDGQVPQAYSREYENHLAEHGIYMDELPGQPQVGQESQSLCRSLLEVIYPEPQYTAFPLSKFKLMWQRARNRNEARICRDITTLLVPSPELLWISGDEALKHVTEEVNAEWTKCSSLAGPMPKPDFAVGISCTAFDEAEMAKMKNYTAFDQPTLFTDNMYFPFLVCEVKSGDQAINKADRQNMHSASIAVNAIVRLHQSVGMTAAALSGKVLVFSISHDNERVKLHGHFVVIRGDKYTFHRYPITSLVYQFEEERGRQRTHNFVRALYQKFYPAHLQRIRDALVLMEEPREALTISTTTTTETEAEAQGENTNPWSSQEASSFQRPGEPASKKQKGELANLREQLAESQRQNKEQMAVLLEQLAEQQRQSREQAEQYKEQIKLLQRLLERQGG